MSSKHTVYCDRCKREVTFPTGWWGFKVYANFKLEWTSPDSEKQADLCKDCANDFKVFLENKDVAQRIA